MPRCCVAPGGTTVIGLRFLTGASLALVYPPAMKIAAGWFRDGRGFALGLLIGALTLGKAFPHSADARSSAPSGASRCCWHPASRSSAARWSCSIVRDGPFVAPTAPFDPHAIRNVLSSRGARLATLGYLGHMWELYAMWTWVAVFATASFAASGVAGASSAGSIAAFVAIGSGAVGCGLAGLHRRSHRQSSRRDVGDAVQCGVRGADAASSTAARRGCFTR